MQTARNGYTYNNQAAFLCYCIGLIVYIMYGHSRDSKDHQDRRKNRA